MVRQCRENLQMAKNEVNTVSLRKCSSLINTKYCPLLLNMTEDFVQYSDKDRHFLYPVRSKHLNLSRSMFSTIFQVTQISVK